MILATAAAAGAPLTPKDLAQRAKHAAELFGSVQDWSDITKTLAACGMPNEDGVNIIVVRKQLVAEGWKLRFEDNEDSDTEEDDF